MNELIVLKQAPIIEFSEMETRGLEVQNGIAQLNIETIESTEENRAMMKKIRATLNKELNVFEEQRKMIHGKITQPYNEFKSSYESNIKSLYEKASGDLKAKISDVETKMLDYKKTLLAAHFEKQNQHKFITLEDVELNIILSATDKKLKVKIDEFLSKIDAEVNSINAMDNSVRILGYYQKTLDLPDSISTVNADIKREKQLEEARIAKEKADKERKEKAAIEAKKQEELQAKQALEKANRDAELAEKNRIQAEQNAKIQASKEAEDAKRQAEIDAQQAIDRQAEAMEYQDRLHHEKAERKAKESAENKIYTVRFEVKGNLGSLKLLKQYMQNEDIKFEAIK